MEQAAAKMGIGVEALPLSIRARKVLSAEYLNLLAAVNDIPLVDPSFEDERLKNIFQYYSLSPDEMETELHLYAKHLLTENKVKEAWQVLLTTTMT